MSILFDFNDSLVIETMEVPWTDQTVTSIKAGTPLDETGAVSNDGDAIGLVAFDVPPAGQNMWGVINGSISSPTVTVKLIKGGYVNLAEVEKSYGYALTDACKSALTGIIFVGEEGLASGALPAPTTEGDVLAVGKVADPSVVILPEQTVEIEEGEIYYLPTGGDPTLFVEGAKVCVTVNNESVVGVVFEDNGLVIELDHECALVYDEDKWWFYDSDSYYGGDPITISVTGTKLGWEAESVGGAYDAVVSIYHDNNSGSESVATIEKGDYESLVEILDSKRTPVLFVKEWNELTHLYANTSVTAVHSYDSNYIDFRVAMPSDIQFNFISLKWTPTNLIIIT